ncbi:MAG: GNAT family N-acetyltransferase [Proteobacteria bacterium]|nr:GNAT family N-acetyltransferase [Pseudomonadota bacterium]
MKKLLIKTELNISRYSVGIADNYKETDELHKLRYDIFNVELGEGIKENEAIQRDIDKFDAHCDHLIVKDNSDEKIIATYRIHPSWQIHNEGFYTSTEFNISKLGLEKRRTIEVGRACIHTEHRGNLVIAILWMAIKEYCTNNKVEALFGTASVPKCNIEELSAMYQSLVSRGHLINDGSVTPLPEQRAHLIPNPPETFRKELLGSLLKGYLKLGAKLIGEPVFDPIFRCYDFFVILEMKNANWDYIDSLAKFLNLES